MKMNSLKLLALLIGCSGFQTVMVAFAAEAEPPAMKLSAASSPEMELVLWYRQRAEIKSLLGKPCRVRFGETVKEFKTRAGKVYTLHGEKLD